MSVFLIFIIVFAVIKADKRRQERYDLTGNIGRVWPPRRSPQNNSPAFFWVVVVLGLFAFKTGVTEIVNLPGSFANTTFLTGQTMQILPGEIRELLVIGMDVLSSLTGFGITIFALLFWWFLLQLVGLINRGHRPDKKKLAIGLMFSLMLLNVFLHEYRNNPVNSPKRRLIDSQLIRKSNASVSRQFQNNGISPIPESIQEELRLSLAKANGAGANNNMDQQNKTEKNSAENKVEYELQSAPCATREKAEAEVMEKLRDLMKERLMPYGLADEESLKIYVTGLNPKTTVQETFKEVAGDKYPIYTGTMQIRLSRDFDQGVVRQLNQLSARNRYEWLMAGSVIAVIALALYDRLLLASDQPASARPPGDTRLA